MNFQLVDACDPSFDLEPKALTHDLHLDALFSDASLADLVKSFDNGGRSFIATGARDASDPFRSLPEHQIKPSEALARLDTDSVRILLKRPEDHDPRFRALADRLYRDITTSNPHAARSPAVRIQASIFISSGETITPVHFDPEVNYFFQIRGRKAFHVFRPDSLDDTLVDGFYNKQVVDIAQVPLSACDPACERVFDLEPGTGLFQPLNAPHWVRTGAGRSISYSFVFETEEMRARGKVRAANHYLRRLGLRPDSAELAGGSSRLKIAAINALIPLRRAVGPVARKYLSLS